MNKLSFCAEASVLPTPALTDKATASTSMTADLIVESFIGSMLANGLATDAEIIADGCLHRFDVEDDKPGSKTGWYILHEDAYPAGKFGCWKRGITASWSYTGKNSSTLTPEDRRRLQSLMEQRQQLRLDEKCQAEAACAAMAKQLWRRPGSATTHPYLERKGVKPYGVKIDGQRLIIPLRNLAGELVGLQTIDKDGRKRFLKGTPKVGHFHTIGILQSDTKCALVSEGYATGATLHEVTGLPVIVAFDAGNLLPVVELLHAHHPAIQLVLCADNDHRSEQNTGLIKARGAAEAVGCRLAIPPFSADSIGTDFNDLRKDAGDAVVNRIIHDAIQAPAPTGLIPVSDLPPAAKPRFEYQIIGGKNYRVGDTGVFAEHEEDGWRFVSSKISVIAATRDHRSASWGKLLRWPDHDGVEHQWAMPMELLQGDGLEMRRYLASLGIHMANTRGARDELANYLGGWKVTARARCVSRLGWEAGVYITADECIGAADEIIVYQSPQTLQPATSQCGTLEDWNRLIGQQAAGNSRLVFAIATALAAPLAGIAGVDSGGFNIRGRSSCGKSTALKVAASVWGRPDRYSRNWRSTANGLEGLATLHNDGLLILDELSQIDPSEAGDAAYMLANGQGKVRAGKNGEARQSAQWRLLFLSAGEVSLTTLMGTAGKTVNAGQEIRMADIPADAGCGMGIFEQLHDTPLPARFAEALVESTNQHHGKVGMTWLYYLVEHRIDLQGRVGDMIQRIVEGVAEASASGQIARVARRFALVAVAGEIATEARIVAWSKGEALSAARSCFRAWLAEFGDDGSREDRRLIDRLKQFVRIHGSSRFENLDSTGRDGIERIHNRAGFVRVNSSGRRYWLLQETFENEICAGIDLRQAQKILIEEGYLVLDKDQRPTVKREFGNNGSLRLYALSSKAVEDND